MHLKAVLYAFMVLGAVAHGSNDDVQIRPKDLSWTNWHMLEEHKLDSYDADSFFKIHDLHNTGIWTRKDILNMYGILSDSVVGDGSGGGEHSHNKEDLSNEAKDHVVKTVLGLMDTNGDGQVSLDEWKAFVASGGELPDFGYGPGHHLDFEAEYEEHHWNEYHRDNDPDVLVKHEEDIEHELLHHDHEVEQSHGHSPEIRKLTRSYLTKVRLQNIPSKFLNN
ncbi:uncharacterized protein PRCAT00002978001 [Priceomyces carsonii]|uniref:uncharacterized protein n=1 Tax=Priceomyces carsonii TaxID=28549 RepID=UPI002ED7790C|nr:unnamed protein product [Priceomyces carsonii]